MTHEVKQSFVIKLLPVLAGAAPHTQKFRLVSFLGFFSLQGQTSGRQSFICFIKFLCFEPFVFAEYSFDFFI